MCSERCHCLVTLSWDFCHQLKSRSSRTSLCPNTTQFLSTQTKPERCKPLLTSYRPLLTPQMFTAISCAVSSQSIQAALGAAFLKHPAKAALSSCSLLQVFDRQTELPGWTGQVSEVMQSLLTSQNPQPAVHTHSCTSLLP